MVYIVYFIIILLANTIGALSGMGGGVIIKPALDALGFHSLTAIGFFSSAAVFTMSIVSIYKQIRGGFEIDSKKLIAIALGSIFGGMIGDRLFVYLTHLFPNESTVNLIQIVTMIIVLGASILYSSGEQKSFYKTSTGWYLFVSLCLAIISTLLGIGGGPINVAVFILIFGHSMKTATTYSIFIIFFSQIAKLSTIGLISGFGGFDLSILMAILPAAVIGGYVGSALNQKMTEKQVNVAYQLITTGVLLLNIYNGIQILF